MLKETFKKITKIDKNAIMFLFYGVLLGIGFHYFNPEGQKLVPSVIGALSSPDLFFLLLFTCIFFLCPRNVFKGPIEGEVSSTTKHFALLPGEAAIDGMRLLSALLLGLLIPMWVNESKWGGLIGSFFLLVMFTNFMSGLLFTFSYKATTWKELGDTGFKIVNGALFLSALGLFYWTFIKVSS
tara:strand:- start:7165 stop:7713 length:549 start_codon:yes stop_codon:yes gene_type:complete